MGWPAVVLWKLSTFAAGLILLLIGSVYYRFSDWDVGVSIIMALLTYLTALFAVRTILRCLEGERIGANIILIPPIKAKFYTPLTLGLQLKYRF